MKACFKCKLFKPHEDFYKHPMMADGYLGKCKECTKADARRVQVDSSERIRAYERHRACLPHRRENARRYAASIAGKKSHSSSLKRYLERYPLKYEAHNKVSNALRDGKLFHQPCEVCGNSKAQAHHDDYTKPLEVRWLCVTHHAEWHRKNEAFYPSEDALEAA